MSIVKEINIQRDKPQQLKCNLEKAMKQYLDRCSRAKH